MTTMRSRFYGLASRALDEDPRAAIVLAEIGGSELPHHHERLFNVGIREQLMIGVTAGLALEGLRPVAHSYAPFLVERPVRADQARPRPPGPRRRARQHRRLVRRRALRAHPPVARPTWRCCRRSRAGPSTSPDTRTSSSARSGRRSPATSASTSGCPRSPTPRRCTARDSTVLRHGSPAAPVVVAVGPTLDETLAATADLDTTVAYLSTVRPFDADGLRALVRGTDVVLVEPYLEGTSAPEVTAALADRPHRLLSLGVPNASSAATERGRSTARPTGSTPTVSALRSGTSFACSVFAARAMRA